MQWSAMRLASYSALQRQLAASLVPYVSEEDVAMSRKEFLQTVADRICSDLLAGDE